MNIETYRDFCLRLHAVSESFPFDNKTLVFKIAGKMFALTNVDDFTSINLKCHPEAAVERMNKKHWNTVLVDGSIPDQLLEAWIKESYDLVVRGLPKKQREAAGF
jgi:predicted DNA-binding protein (MmcQ/YjbR family)